MLAQRIRAEWIPGLVAQNPDGSLPDCHATASGSAPCTSLTLLACLRINCKSGVHRAASTSILVSSLLRVLGVMAEVFLPSLVFPVTEWRAIMDRMKLWVMRLLAQGALHCLTCLSPGRRGATATPTVTEPYKSILKTILPTAPSRSRAGPRMSRALSIQCAATFSWRNVVHMRLHHSAPGRCLRLRYDVASHLQGQGRRKINIGQDEPENEEAGQDQSDDEEAGPHHHEREEAGPDKHNDEEARQNQHNDESARQDQHEEREPEQTGEGDAAGRQEQREHDGSTATSKPVDSRAEKEEEKNKDTPDTDVRRGGTGVLPQGTVGNQRPISPERPPKRQAAASEADGACLALNGIVTVSLLTRACRRLPRAAGREPNGTGSSPLDASTRAVVLAVVSQVQAAAQTQVSRRMTCH